MKFVLRRLLPLLALCMALSSCGAILEEATEQALEQGGVELELDDVEDGEFTVTIEGEDGEEAVLDIDGEEGTVDFETDEGEGTFSISGELAEGWPAEFSLPDDAVVINSFASDEGDRSVYLATFTGPTGSLEQYLEHFNGLDVPTVDEAEVLLDDSQQQLITWGTEEEPLGSVLVGDNGEELFGQITLELPN